MLFVVQHSPNSCAINGTGAFYSLGRQSTTFSLWLALQFANETYPAIRSLAFRDATKWNTGIDIDRGYRQIIKEYAPARKYMLLR